MAEDTRLAAIRQRIDAIDRQLQTLLNDRARCAQAVAEVKQAAAKDAEAPVFYRPEREAQILRDIIDRNEGPLPGEQVAFIIREIMSACLALEQPLQVAYLGPKGTFSQAAAIKQFGHAARLQPCTGVKQIFAAVETGQCDYGVVAVENSTEGVVNHTLDCLVSSPLTICGELELAIELKLLLAPGAAMSSVKRICAHQQALAQSRNWLASQYPQIEQLAVSSNAEAAAMAQQDTSVAAVAGAIAAEAYGLHCVAANIQDSAANTTRFLVIARQPVPPSGNDKTCLMVSARNEAGALYNLLKPFNDAGINMTCLTSRPSRTENWAYVFFMEFEGHTEQPEVAAIIAELEAHSYAIKNLGSFPVAAV